MSEEKIRPLPEALCQQVSEMLLERYQPWLRPGERTDLCGALTSETVELTLFVERGARGEGGERWEATVQLDPAGREEEAVLALALDAADAALSEWLEEGRERRPPPEFEEAKFQGETLGLRLRRRQPKVEEAGDTLLEES